MNNPMAVNLMALLLAAGPVLAQQQTAPPPAAPAASSSGKPAAQATAQSEAGDPRADTSNAPTTAPSPTPAPSATLVPSTTSAQPAARSAARPATGRAQAGSAADGRSTTPGAGAGQKPASKIDRLDLGTATVTGDREQPKVMYIVPWKRSDIGDLTGKPMNSLVDEILAPVDRDVFKREVVYYNAVNADESQNGAPPKAGRQGEK